MHSYNTLPVHVFLSRNLQQLVSGSNPAIAGAFFRGHGERLSIYLQYLSIYLSIYLYLYLYLSLSIYLSIYLSTYQNSETSGKVLRHRVKYAHREHTGTT